MSWLRNNPGLVGCWLVLSASACVFYARAWPQAPVETPDSATYRAMARDLSDGSLDVLHRRTPGYPLLILLSRSVEGPGRPIFYVQFALHCLAALLAALMLRGVGISGISAGVVMVFAYLPTSIQASGFMLTESLTHFTLVAGVAFLIRGIRAGGWHWAVLSGLSFTCAALTRPTFQLLGPSLSVALVGLLILDGRTRVRTRRVAAMAAIIFSISVIGVGGYVLHNRVKFGFTGFAPVAGFHLCNTTAAILERIPDEDARIREALIRARDRQFAREHTTVNYIWPVIPALCSEMELSERELSAYLQKININLIIGAPMSYAVVVISSIGQYFFSSVTGQSTFDSRIVQGIWFILHFLLLGVSVFIIIRWLGGWMFWRRIPLNSVALSQVWGYGDGLSRRAAAMVISVLMAYTCFLSNTMDVGSPRYREPTDLLFACFLAIGLDASRRMARSVSAPVSPDGALATSSATNVA